jgi:hypothetical protein
MGVPRLDNFEKSHGFVKDEIIGLVCTAPTNIKMVINE